MTENTTTQTIEYINAEGNSKHRSSIFKYLNMTDEEIRNLSKEDKKRMKEIANEILDIKTSIFNVLQNFTDKEEFNKLNINIDDLTPAKLETIAQDNPELEEAIGKAYSAMEQIYKQRMDIENKIEYINAEGDSKHRSSISKYLNMTDEEIKNLSKEDKKRMKEIANEIFDIKTSIFNVLQNFTDKEEFNKLNINIDDLTPAKLETIAQDNPELEEAIGKASAMEQIYKPIYKQRMDIESKVNHLPNFYLSSSYFEEELPILKQYLGNKDQTKHKMTQLEIALLHENEVNLIRDLFVEDVSILSTKDKLDHVDVLRLLLAESKYQKSASKIIGDIERENNININSLIDEEDYNRYYYEDYRYNLNKEQTEKIADLLKSDLFHEKKAKILRYLSSFNKADYKMLIPQNFSVDNQKWQLILDKYNELEKAKNFIEALNYIHKKSEDKLVDLLINFATKGIQDQSEIENLKQKVNSNENNIIFKLRIKLFCQGTEQELEEVFNLANEIKRENNKEEIVRFKDVTLSDLGINVLNPTETPTNQEVTTNPSNLVAPDASQQQKLPDNENKQVDNNQQQNPTINSSNPATSGTNQQPTAQSNPVKTVVKTGNKLFSLNNIINPILNALASSKVIISKLVDDGFGYAVSASFSIRKLDDDVFGSAVYASKILTASRVMTFVPALVIELVNMAYTKFYKKEEFSIKDSIFRFFSAGISTLLAAFTIGGFATGGLGVAAYVGLAFAFNVGMQAGYNKFVNNDITPDNTVTTAQDKLASQNQQQQQSI